MKLPPEWREFIGLLSSHRVRFLIVGAHALAAHGRPRATQDIDIFVEPTGSNARRVCAALADFGFAALSASVPEFAKPDRMATLGRPPLRIDVMTSITGVSFRDAWRGRVEIAFGDRKIAFLGLAELVRNKKAAARPKDLLDIALLEEVESPPRRRRQPPRKRQRTRPARRRTP
jgi:hypothetical protein